MGSSLLTPAAAKNGAVEHVDAVLSKARGGRAAPELQTAWAAAPQRTGSIAVGLGLRSERV